MSDLIDPQQSRRRSPDRGLKTPRLILGLTLIAIGVAYTLDRLGYLDASELWHYWPVVLIAAGLSKMLAPGSSSGRTTGLLIAAVGAWLLLENLDLVDIHFWDWWPLLLVAVGVRVMLSPRSRVSGDSHNTVNGFAMMGGTVRKNTSSDFRGGDLVAFMGGCEVDLRGARIAKGPAVIDAFAFWGGIELRVPETWKVTVHGIPLLGGFEDSTALEADAGPTQELVVKGFAIMGGVEIRN